MLSNNPPLDVYTAAVAIAAAILKRSLEGELDPPTLMQNMQDAIDLLRSYAQTRPSARRCLATLTSILQLKTTNEIDIEPENGQLQVPEQQLPMATFDGDDTTHGGYGVNAPFDMSWTVPVGAENAAFELLSDQWLLQPQLDSFNYLGI